MTLMACSGIYAAYTLEYRIYAAYTLEYRIDVAYIRFSSVDVAYIRYYSVFVAYMRYSKNNFVPAAPPEITFCFQAMIGV
jgi:hypothetical protein